MFDHEMRDAAERVLLACRERKLKVVTAESCTGSLAGKLVNPTDALQLSVAVQTHNLRIEMKYDCRVFRNPLN